MIIELGLENFQSVKEKQEISLEGITLLYGNNSSGKSIIKDALSIAVKMHDGANNVFDQTKWVNHYAYEQDEYVKLSYTFYGITGMRVGSLRDSAAADFFSDLFGGTALGSNVEKLFAINLEDAGLRSLYDYLRRSIIRVKYFYGEYDEESSPVLKRQEFHTGAFSSLEPVEDEMLQLELLMTTEFEDEFVNIHLNEKHPLYILLSEELKSSQFLTNADLPKIKLRLPFFSDLSTALLDQYYEGIYFTGEFDLFDTGFFLVAIGTIGADFMVSEAARYNFINDIRDRSENQQTAGDFSTTEWHSLKKSVFYHKLKMGQLPGMSETSLLNKWLLSEKYLNTGYELDAKFEFLIGMDDVTNIENLGVKDFLMNKLNEGEFEHSKLMLKDVRSGKLLDFQDVGTGLSQVLPILFNLSHSGLFGNSLYIQQPELHLHPKLQADLAQILNDAYITNDKAISYIIETHSELIILRLLKIIRNNYQHDNKLEQRMLLADDVNVIFAKKDDRGVTTYQHLRISKDGDFLDKWPDGFFEERDLELF